MLQEAAQALAANPPPDPDEATRLDLRHHQVQTSYRLKDEQGLLLGKAQTIACTSSAGGRGHRCMPRAVGVQSQLSEVMGLLALVGQALLKSLGTAQHSCSPSMNLICDDKWATWWTDSGSQGDTCCLNVCVVGHDMPQCRAVHLINAKVALLLVTGNIWSASCALVLEKPLTLALHSSTGRSWLLFPLSRSRATL